MLPLLRVLLQTQRRFRHYEPQRVNLIGLWKWLWQFPWQNRFDLLRLLAHIRFYTANETRRSLLDLNNQVLKLLQNDGIGIDNVVYVSIDDAGSSSQVMLSMLRDAANLTRRNAHLVDSKNKDGLLSITSDLYTGAVIYVDDFSGSGRQFTRNWKWTSQFIAGNFSEFLIAPCICEEAFDRISKTAVQPITSHVHRISERPLHIDCDLLPAETKQRLIELCRNISRSWGLGFLELATMVVFYRNSPNSTPLVLRGSLEQNPFQGIFPRSDDLPFS